MPRRCPKGVPSKLTWQKPVDVNRIVPTGLEMNLAAQGTDANDAMFWRERNKLGDGVAVAGDDDTFALGHGAEQFGEMFFGVGYGNVHEPTIARINGYQWRLWIGGQLRAGEGANALTHTTTV